jgi:hypothetical protein
LPADGLILLAFSSARPNIFTRRIRHMHSAVEFGVPFFGARSMPIYADIFKRSDSPQIFREIVSELRDLPYSDWTPWEEHVFLRAMLRYSSSYIYSEKERKKLAELCWFSEEVYGHEGVSVERMITSCLRYHMDFQPDDSDWIVELNRRGATFLRRREIKRLVSLCRLSGMDLIAA